MTGCGACAVLYFCNLNPYNPISCNLRRMLRKGIVKLTLTGIINTRNACHKTLRSQFDKQTMLQICSVSVSAMKALARLYVIISLVIIFVQCKCIESYL